MQPGNPDSSGAAPNPPAGTNRFQKPKPAVEEGRLPEAQPDSPAGPWLPREAAVEEQSTPDAQMLDDMTEVSAAGQHPDARIQDTTMYSTNDTLGNAGGGGSHSTGRPIRAATWGSDAATLVARPSPNRQLIFEQYSRTDAEAAAAAAAASAEGTQQATLMALDTFTPKSVNPEMNLNRQGLHDLEATIAHLQDEQRVVSARNSLRATYPRFTRVDQQF